MSVTFSDQTEGGRTFEWVLSFDPDKAEPSLVSSDFDACTDAHSFLHIDGVGVQEPMDEKQAFPLLIQMHKEAQCLVDFLHTHRPSIRSMYWKLPGRALNMQTAHCHHCGVVFSIV
jgi:phage-related protein